MKFEWDARKNRRNAGKHGISFELASEIFSGRTVSFRDARRDYGENRIVTLGELEGMIIIAVVHTDREGKLRIISARKANRKERTLYEKHAR